MTTAHRPQLEARSGAKNITPTNTQHARLLPGHKTLKKRMKKNLVEGTLLKNEKNYNIAKQKQINDDLITINNDQNCISTTPSRDDKCPESPDQKNATSHDQTPNPKIKLEEPSALPEPWADNSTSHDPQNFPSRAWRRDRVFPRKLKNIPEKAQCGAHDASRKARSDGKRTPSSPPRKRRRPSQN
ncbi:hypothetical protein TBLA_0H01150 [Henningerozyma blattae CBS 6284]|uniref:Uncharacterized protein n=1 Tax=Henningerozyma blattae (strain ATCC 34711 / CBS 6284 / DSM 70876 / NBRC 10599 / NRRL Y-10934 / UCD 77-7) TaxID=1071380 RepID=I2H7Q1_HENB6|nr:hypothetical protein TBLA_0H01150 [Tetrapisispora blattae CBS 6284]CCH62403.1 hypothetical protein TBLA_0H01150 [Tetrapisispora blattae CBS 6284]